MRPRSGSISVVPRGWRWYLQPRRSSIAEKARFHLRIRLPRVFAEEFRTNSACGLSSEWDEQDRPGHRLKNRATPPLQGTSRSDEVYLLPLGGPAERNRRK